MSDYAALIAHLQSNTVAVENLTAALADHRAATAESIAELRADVAALQAERANRRGLWRDTWAAGFGALLGAAGTWLLDHLRIRP